MALSSAAFTASAAAVTAAGTATAKVTALLATLCPAMMNDICTSGPLTANQYAKMNAAMADLAANVATFQTALGL